ncbi:MAG: hypothetical protein DMG49_01815 [Acidobacteria bacterium]|nr:MAG: hypothetical protein DMG49_01815 [Acidobacteriota bacterium]
MREAQKNRPHFGAGDKGVEMESNRKDTHAILLLVALTVGLLIVFTARITGASGSAERRQRTPAQSTSPQNANSVAVQMSAPFRDGLYVGRITSEHGNEPHIAVGRWASVMDRTLYASGYRQGYNQQIVNAEALRLGH